MSIFYVRNSDDNQRLRLYLFLFAEYDGEAEDGWARYRCEPEHEKPEIIIGESSMRLQHLKMDD